MEGIYYKDGVYVVIDNDRHKYNDQHYGYCVCHYQFKNKVLLYGGRVRVKYLFSDLKETAYLLIDGIEIIKLNELSLNDKPASNELNLSTISQYLNAIEANGVDAFMQHYKERLEQLQVDLQDLKKEKESELSTITEEPLLEEVKQEIKNIKKLLCYLFTVLFNLSLFICAGLENEKVISVYQSIMETIT